MVNFVSFVLHLLALTLIAVTFSAASLALRCLGIGRRSHLRFGEPFTRS